MRGGKGREARKEEEETCCLLLLVALVRSFHMLSDDGAIYRPLSPSSGQHCDHPSSRPLEQIHKSSGIYTCFHEQFSGKFVCSAYTTEIHNCFFYTRLQCPKSGPSNDFEQSRLYLYPSRLWHPNRPTQCFSEQPFSKKFI